MQVGAQRLGWQHQQRLARKPAHPVPNRARRLLVKVETAESDHQPVHDGRLPFLKCLEQFVSPEQYAKKVLEKYTHKFAWGKYGPGFEDALFVADVAAARTLMASEAQLGIRSDFPDTFRGMIGESGVSMIHNLDMHARLRQYLTASFTKESIQALLPQLQQTAASHFQRWEAATATATSGAGDSASNAGNDSKSAHARPGSSRLTTTADGSMILGYPALRLLTFDVLVNTVLRLRMSDQEVQQYEVLFKDLINGFMPPAWDVPFTPYGKGMSARRQIVARVTETLSSPQCSGPLARLRDEFGAHSAEAVDNTINLLFAGFDTTSSSISYMLWLLAQHPEVLQKVQAEQAAVVSKHGPTLNPAAYADMPYTQAVVKETLRAAQIIAYVPRVATRELKVPGGPTLPAGCPFIMALSAISASDPALQKTGDGELFRPERWLDPAAAKSLSQYQMPMGTGQRTCLGINLAYAEMAAVLAELSRKYSFAVAVDTKWNDFPIKNPVNLLPLRLTRKAAVGQAVADAAGESAVVQAS